MKQAIFVVFAGWKWAVARAVGTAEGGDVRTELKEDACPSATTLSSRTVTNANSH